MDDVLKRLSCILLVAFAAAAQRPQRGVDVQLDAAPAAKGNGAYYALVIGINRYRNWPQLQTAVNDARAIDDTLRQRFGFRTRLLLDADATAANIIDAIQSYRQVLHDNDNLLIYYAGHGTRDGVKAYWLPVDSAPKHVNWLIADEITNATVTNPARHILILSDSCYSGGLTRDIGGQPGFEGAKSRALIASGREERVSDAGVGGHSPFANAVLTGFSRMNGGPFTAMNLFAQYIKPLTVGKSEQVPVYNTIQNSGDEGGDFVFFPRGVTTAGGTGGHIYPLPDRTPPAPAPPPVSEPAHASSTRLAPDGRSAQAPPADPSGYLPLTQYRAILLEVRDAPQLVTDAVLNEISTAQVATEQGVWYLMDEDAKKNPPGLNPQRSQFLFEWQKLADSNPAFAKSALLPVFLRPDADWSFLKREKGWDEKYDAWVYVFLFAREKIQGRQAEFAARELAPVMKRHLQMAASMAVTKLYFEVPVTIGYDFNLSAIRFKQQGHQEFAASLDLADPLKDVVFTPPPPDARNTPQSLPPAARSTANYRVIPGANEPLAKPGLGPHGILSSGDPRTDPAQAWRSNLPGSWRGAFPVMTTAALDRQLKLTSAPLDVKRAEQLGPVLNAACKARVYINAERMDIGAMIYEHKPQQFGVLFAKVQRVDVIGPRGEVVASIPASALPGMTSR